MRTLDDVVNEIFKFIFKRGIEELEVFGVKRKINEVSLKGGGESFKEREDLKIYSTLFYNRTIFSYASSEVVPEKYYNEIKKSSEAIGGNFSIKKYINREYPYGEVEGPLYIYDRENSKKEIRFFLPFIKKIYIDVKKEAKESIDISLKREIVEKSFSNTRGIKGSFIGSKFALSIEMSDKTCIFKKSYRYFTNFAKESVIAKKIVRELMERKKFSKGKGREELLSTMPVLLSSDVMFSVLDTFFKFLLPEKSKIFLKILGEKVFSRNLTIYDSSIIEGYPETHPFDDDGIVADESELIKNGVLLKGYTNRFYNAIYGMSGIFSADKDVEPVRGISNSNFFIMKGEVFPEEILDGAKKLFYIKRFSKVGESSNYLELFGEGEGMVYSNGKPYKYIKGLKIRFSIPELFKSILSVANDLEFNENGIGSPSIFVISGVKIF